LKIFQHNLKPICAHYGYRNPSVIEINLPKKKDQLQSIFKSYPLWTANLPYTSFLTLKFNAISNRGTVTGGAGFIGSHTVVELLEAGHHVTVIDDCSNTAPPARVGGIPPSLERVQQIVGPLMAKRLKFVLGDVTDPQDLDFAFGLKKKHAVIHFAGLKAVGESKEKPLRKSFILPLFLRKTKV